MGDSTHQELAGVSEASECSPQTCSVHLHLLISDRGCQQPEKELRLTQVSRVSEANFISTEDPTLAQEMNRMQRHTLPVSRGGYKVRHQTYWKGDMFFQHSVS